MLSLGIELLPILVASSSILLHFVATFNRVRILPPSWFLPSLLLCHVVVFSFADIVFVVAVAVVAVIVVVILVSVRVTSSDLCWVATGTNIILPLPLPSCFESRLEWGLCRV